MFFNSRYSSSNISTCILNLYLLNFLSRRFYSTNTFIPTTLRPRSKHQSHQAINNHHRTRYYNRWVAHHPRSPLLASRSVPFCTAATRSLRISATSQIQRPSTLDSPIRPTLGSLARGKQPCLRRPLRSTHVMVDQKRPKLSPKRLLRRTLNEVSSGSLRFFPRACSRRVLSIARKRGVPGDIRSIWRSENSGR